LIPVEQLFAEWTNYFKKNNYLKNKQKLMECTIIDTIE
jgi:hypothetical protein